MSKIIKFILNLFSRELSPEEKNKYNIANYKPKTEQIIQQKPNIIDKVLGI